MKTCGLTRVGHSCHLSVKTKGKGNHISGPGGGGNSERDDNRSCGGMSSRGRGSRLAFRSDGRVPTFVPGNGGGRVGSKAVGKPSKTTFLTGQTYLLSSGRHHSRTSDGGYDAHRRSARKLDEGISADVTGA